MFKFNVFALLSLVLCILFHATTVESWDFAVTTQSKIEFFDYSWSPIYTAAHQFSRISSLAFDETAETIYFNDRYNGSIFSLKISATTFANSNDEIEHVVLRNIINETIMGLAVDPLDQQIYWTDSRNRKIYRHSMIDSPNVEVVHDFFEEKTIPDDLAIDVCRRKLYWTNSNHKNATVERSDLDGGNREILINSKLFLPHGIVVDQFVNRIYWVVDQEGIHFSVESADLDGSNREVLIEGLNNVPLNLVVTKDKIFWTDSVHKGIWSIEKFKKSDPKPILVKTFVSRPKGIIARLGFLSNLSNDRDCREVINSINSRIAIVSNTSSSESPQIELKKSIFCMNGGEYNALSGGCNCKIGFVGLRCETKECHNYCVHGNCEVDGMGFPKCICQQGFYGERCENYLCADYCLNDGKCRLTEDEDEILRPQCTCGVNFIGPRCEFNSTEVCSTFCKLLKYDKESPVPYGCSEICEDLNIVDKELLTASAAKYLEQINECNTNLNLTIIFAVVGLIVALFLVFCIVKVVKSFYKSTRPKIKKTFVVKKNYTQTPLTSRPVAAEQCEITIENCCNMNICDTPCFDPKLLQQSLDNKTKEDKRMLLNNMEGDLY